MRTLFIGALVAIIAGGGALGVYAASHTVETEATVEVAVWQRIRDDTLYLSTRPEGGQWETHRDALDLSTVSESGRFRRSGIVTVAVPVTFEFATPTPTAENGEAVANVLTSVAVEFDGEFSAAVEEAFLAEFTRVVRFFAAHYGLVAEPGLRLRVLENVSNRHDGWYDYENRMIALSEQSLEAMAHEYVHALQLELSKGRAGTRWLIEGIAEYFAAVYTAAYDENYTAASDLRSTRDLARNAHGRGTLQSTENDITASDGDKYALATVAAEYLEFLAGEKLLWGFYQQLARSESWEEAFEAAFGFSVDDFYLAFEAHRALTSPPWSIISGVVLDADAAPVQGVLVQVSEWYPYYNSVYRARYDTTRSDGTFSVASYRGRLRLTLLGHCQQGLGFEGSERSMYGTHELPLENIGAEGLSGLVIRLLPEPCEAPPP
ncbi:MAG: hypothetical protein F4Z77_08875 [Dehalococcoidia bacterium]|nr:hypothetical protein [Dehalococcoidia bacterium]MYA52064.1 hypothetical protein [Dehalococcoidia bacterium]